MSQMPFVLRVSKQRIESGMAEESALVEPLPAAVPLEPTFLNADGGTAFTRVRGETTDDE